MNDGAFGKQNIFPLLVEEIPKIIEIAEQSDLSKWTFKDYSDELSRRDSSCWTYKNYIYEDNKPGQEIIVGFIIARLINNCNVVSRKTPNEDFQNAGECEILNIAVHMAFRKKGIGQQLLDAVVEKCLDAKVASIWLEVRKHNAEAFKFYHRNRFEVVYTRKNYYQNPSDDALVMRAELSQTFTL